MRSLSLLNRMTIRKKISTVFIIIVLIPSIVIGIVVIRSEEQNRKQRLLSETETRLHLMSEDILTKAGQVKYLIGLLALDEDLQPAFQYGSTTYGDFAVKMTYNVAPRIYSISSYLVSLNARIMLTTPDENTPEIYEFLMHQSRFSEQDIFDDIMNGKNCMWGEPGWHMPEGLLNQFYYVTPTMPFYQRVLCGVNETIGIIKCSVSLDQLFSILYTNDSTEDVLVCRNGKCLYSSAKKSLFDVTPVNSGISTYNNQTYYSVELADMNMYLTTRIPNIGTIEKFRTFAPSIGLILLFTVVILLISHMEVDRVLIGLKDIEHTILHVDNENPDILLPVRGEDELSRLFHAFNQLLTLREQQTSLIAKQEENVHTAQILALQCQMNPHFLFNSLNWLQLTIETGRVNEQTSDAIAYLGQILHYNMCTSNLSTISEELENLRTYLQFMDIREQGAIHADIQCPKELLSYPFLRFSLQPIVENAVHHGKIHGQELNLYVRFENDNDNVYLKIANDGKEINEAELETINFYLKKDAPFMPGSLGLSNLARRLHLLYDNAQIRICSANGLVEVEITVKKIRGEVLS